MEVTSTLLPGRTVLCGGEYTPYPIISLIPVSCLNCETRNWATICQLPTPFSMSWISNSFSLGLFPSIREWQMHKLGCFLSLGQRIRQSNVYRLHLKLTAKCLCPCRDGFVGTKDARKMESQGLHLMRPGNVPQVQISWLRTPSIFCVKGGRLCCYGDFGMLERPAAWVIF